MREAGLTDIRALASRVDHTMRTILQQALITNALNFVEAGDTFSRDGSQYAIPVYRFSGGIRAQYLYGSVKTGGLKAFATQTENSSDFLDELIGWTTM
jgi:hypothetical protein